LGDYITVYFNNVLVYLNKSRKDYIKKDVGLNLDLKKYIFVVKEVKYLGYIVEVEVYIYFNPKKIKAIYK
ncbi:uncharacterized protein THITE_2042071, partial [Thermothielavioides terrestris NRRL 8126]